MACTLITSRVRGWKRTAPWRRRATRLLSILAVMAAIGTACSRSGSQGVQQSYNVWARGFQYQGFPTSIKSGLVALAFANREPFPITHELVVVSLPPGASARDVTAADHAKGTASEDEWLHWGEIGEVETGSTHVGLFDLRPGRYALACWQTGTTDGGTGPPHAALGMVYSFTVTP